MFNLQQQIQSVMQQLEDLATQVAKPVTDSSLDFEKLLLEATNNPFQYHIVEQHDEYVRSLYLQILMSIIHQSEASKMERYSLVARIYSNFGMNDSFESYLNKSKTLTIQDVSQFYSILQESDLTEVFLIDSLMILGIHQEKRIGEYVAELVSNLDISQEDFSRACHIVKAILTVDHEGIHNLFEENRTFQLSVGHYLTAISSKFAPIVNIVGDGNTVVDLSDYHSQILTLEKVKIKNTSKKMLSTIEKLTLKDCTINDEKVQLKINRIKEVIIENLQFPNNKQTSHDNSLFSIKPLIIKNVENLHISNLHLNNLNVKNDYLFEISHVDKFTFTKNIFEKISTQSKQNFALEMYMTIIHALISVDNIAKFSEKNNKLLDCKIFHDQSYRNVDRIVHTK